MRPISSTSSARYGTWVGPSGATRHDTTRRSSSGSGRGRSRMPRISVNITVAPAMPIGQGQHGGRVESLGAGGAAEGQPEVVDPRGGHGPYLRHRSRRCNPASGIEHMLGRVRSRLGASTLAAFLAVLTVGAGYAPTVPPARPDTARPLPLGAVRLTGGPLKRAQDLDAQYLLALEPDRMMALYRQRAGLPAEGEPSADGTATAATSPATSPGHYLSAVSLMWAATGDPRFKERADESSKAARGGPGQARRRLPAGAGGCARVLRPHRQGRHPLSALRPQRSLGAVVRAPQDDGRTPRRLPPCREPRGAQVSVRAATWTEGVVSKLSDEQMQTMLATEFGGMPEVLADLYADTGDPRWLALSRRFDHRAVLDPLLRGEDRLSGLHGNTNIPKLHATAVRYGYAGDEGDLTAADVFWRRVVGHHTFATGGHSKDEHLRDPDRYGAIVDGRTAESCNVYNMLKLTRRLFAHRPDVGYAEFQERALFNHVLGSIDPDRRRHLLHGARRPRRPARVRRHGAQLHVLRRTGMESHGLHGLGLYHESGDTLWVNLYAPSRAEWTAAQAVITQETDFPRGRVGAPHHRPEGAAAIHAGSPPARLGGGRLHREGQRPGGEGSAGGAGVCRARPHVEGRRRRERHAPEDTAARADAGPPAARRDPLGPAGPGGEPGPGARAVGGAPRRPGPDVAPDRGRAPGDRLGQAGPQPSGRVPDGRCARGPGDAPGSLLPAAPPRVRRVLRPLHAGRVAEGTGGAGGRARTAT